jgi:hypothetical protein
MRFYAEQADFEQVDFEWEMQINTHHVGQQRECLDHEEVAQADQGLPPQKHGYWATEPGRR